MSGKSGAAPADRLINDLKCIPSPVFYIFAAVSLFSSFFVLGFNPYSVFVSIFLLLLTAAASADLNRGIIPDLIVFAIALTAVIEYFVCESLSAASLIDRLEGAVIIFLPMLITAMFVKGAFGGGDIKLMAAAGLFMGMRSVLQGAVAGMIMAGLYGIYILLIKKSGAKARIKLAPFMALGLGFVILFGDLPAFVSF